MYAIIDTETTGLFDFTKPADAEGQPRMATLSLILVNAGFEVISRKDYAIKPDGWEMSAQAGAVNGLTTEHLAAVGVPVRDALEEYSSIVKSGAVVVAYNAQFDTKILRAELRRAGMPDLFEETKNICVMRPCTSLVKIARAGSRSFKFPKLSEACAYFGITLTGAHSAAGDADAAHEITKKLSALGLLPEPSVFKAAPETVTAIKSQTPSV